MSCPCTEDKEVVGNVIIGRNRFTCQECLDSLEEENQRRTNQMIYNALNEIDRRSIRAIREGDATRIANLEAEAVLLRAQLQ